MREDYHKRHSYVVVGKPRVGTVIKKHKIFCSVISFGFWLCLMAISSRLDRSRLSVNTDSNQGLEGPYKHHVPRL